MTRLPTQHQRLYLLPAADGAASAGPLVAHDGRVRALVLDVMQPAGWDALGAVWRGVQADLGWPAPAIAVSGTDALQLWFSLAQPVPASDGVRVLAALRDRYLVGVPAKAVRCWPALDPAGGPPRHAALVPAQMPSGDWSAFVAADLAPVFADTPWLDLPPGDDAQAEQLSRLTAIGPDAWDEAVASLLGPAGPAAGTSASVAGGQDDALNAVSGAARMGGGAGGSSTSGAVDTAGPAPGALEAASEARAFLLTVVHDPAAPLRLRVEAARALLP